MCDHARFRTPYLKKALTTGLPIIQYCYPLKCSMHACIFKLVAIAFLGQLNVTEITCMITWSLHDVIHDQLHLYVAIVYNT